MARKAQTQSLADANAAPGGTAAVDRALTLLAAFKVGDSALSLAVLAERTQLYKSTVLRLLASLEHAHMVQRLADGRYALGPEIARLQALYAASFSLASVLLPALQKLVKLTGESAAFHVWQGDLRLCLYRVDSPHPVRDHIKAGDILPADRGTGARILMAFARPEKSASSKKDQALFKLIRQQGFFAASGDRLKEVAGISAPVFKADASLGGALTLSMPSHRFQQKYIQAVQKVAAELGGKI